jgi:hypothetical protein
MKNCTRLFFTNYWFSTILYGFACSSYGLGLQFFDFDDFVYFNFKLVLLGFQRPNNW